MQYKITTHNPLEIIKPRIRASAESFSKSWEFEWVLNTQYSQETSTFIEESTMICIPTPGGGGVLDLNL